MKKWTISLNLLTAVALASPLELPSMLPGEMSADVSRVQKVFTLKEATTESPTRINLLVLDAGGSTDVSPKMDLLLTFWQDGEMRDATGAFMLDNSYSLQDFTYNTAGGRKVLLLKTKHLEDSGYVVRHLEFDFTAYATKFEQEAATVDSSVNWPDTEYVEGTLWQTLVR